LEKESPVLEKLCPLALELLDLAPWNWLYESDLFGLVPQDTDIPWFASIMGSAGEFTAVSYYEGVHAAGLFLHLQEQAEGARPEDILLMPHLMVSFDHKEQIQPEDRKRLRACGYHLKRRRRWPVFQQVVPGHPPAFPQEDKLQELLPLLEQTLIVARRAQKEDLSFVCRTKEGINGFCRTGATGEAPESWRDEIQTFQPVHKSDSVRYSHKLVEKLNRIPGTNIIMEVDLVLMPAPVQDKDPAYFPFLLLLIDQRSGYIVHFEMLTPHPSLDEMFASSGQLLLELLMKQKIRPRQIQVRSPRLYSIFENVLSDTPVLLSHRADLPATKEAMESLINFLG
jgi:hypothetical protein